VVVKVQAEQAASAKATPAIVAVAMQEGGAIRTARLRLTWERLGPPRRVPLVW
jgi:hypothetical protein